MKHNSYSVLFNELERKELTIVITHSEFIKGLICVLNLLAVEIL